MDSQNDLSTEQAPVASSRPTDKPKRQRSPRLNLIYLGGLGEVGRNMMLLEYRGQILIIDAGFRMPEEDMPGIDYIIPNIAYLRGKERNILGAVFTHGHYDHIGAIPYAWPRLGNPPIYAGKLTKGIMLNRQEDFAYQPKLDITEVQSGSRIKIGPFKIEFFRQNHNIPSNFGLFIQTPAGNIVHTSDFKFDNDPINDLPTDFGMLEKIGQRGITLLMSDSTGAENEGHSLSERLIFENLDKLFQETKGRIISSTFASHLNRVQQIIALSEKYGRKVFLEGFSMKSNVEIAKNLKYLNVKPDTLLKPNQINKYPDERISFLCTGAQGETGAVLMKMANREYKFLRLKKGDTIIFSSSVIPGNERTVQFLKDQFYRQGAHVYHYQMMDIHASGHGHQEELKRMINMMKPKFFLPIHGQYSMLFEHANIAEGQGLNRKNIIIADNGDVVSFNQERYAIERNKVPSNYVMVDGLGIGDVGEVVLRDRQTLAQDGMFVIIVIVDGQTGKVKGSPDIISRGFVYLRESKDLLKETRQRVIGIVEKSTLAEARTVNSAYIKDELRDQIGDFLFSQTKRRPMVLPVVIEV
ncbi:MAG: ribonuclease J [Candidatus Pacebacteria bacterium]|nr:ribonuclease J [Candidatus Paceibacterota bacterium]